MSTESPGRDQVADRLHRRAVEEGVARHQYQAELLRQIRKMDRFRQ